MKSDIEEEPSSNNLVNSSNVDLIDLAEINTSYDSLIWRNLQVSDNEYAQKFQVVFKNRAYVEHLQYLTEINPPKDDVLDEINNFLKIEKDTFPYKMKFFEHEKIVGKLNKDTSLMEINTETAKKLSEWSTNFQKAYHESNGLLRIAQLDSSMLEAVDKFISKETEFTYNSFLDLRNASTPKKSKCNEINKDESKPETLPSSKSLNKINVKEQNRSISSIGQKDKRKHKNNLRKSLFSQSDSFQSDRNENQEKKSNLKSTSVLRLSNSIDTINNRDELCSRNKSKKIERSKTSISMFAKNSFNSDTELCKQLDKENLDGIQALNISSTLLLYKENTSRYSHIQKVMNKNHSTTITPNQLSKNSSISSDSQELRTLRNKIVNNKVQLKKTLGLNNSFNDGNIKKMQSIGPIEAINSNLQLPPVNSIFFTSYVKLCRSIDEDIKNLKLPANIHQVTKGEKKKFSKNIRTTPVKLNSFSNISGEKETFDSVRAQMSNKNTPKRKTQSSDKEEMNLLKSKPILNAISNNLQGSLNLSGSECEHKDIKVRSCRASSSFLNAKKTESNSRSGNSEQTPKKNRGRKRKCEESESLTSSNHTDSINKEDQMPNIKNIEIPNDVSSSFLVENINETHGLRKVTKNSENNSCNKTKMSYGKPVLHECGKISALVSANTTELMKNHNQVVECSSKSQKLKNTVQNQNEPKSTRGRKRVTKENVDNSQKLNNSAPPNLNENINQRAKLRKTEKHCTVNNSSTIELSQNVRRLRNREINIEAEALGTSRNPSKLAQSDSNKDKPNKKDSKKTLKNNNNNIRLPTQLEQHCEKQSIKSRRVIKPKNQMSSEADGAVPTAKKPSANKIDLLRNGNNELAKSSTNIKIPRRGISPQKLITNVKS